VGGKSLTITKKTTSIIVIHVYYRHDWYARIIKVVKKPKFCSLHSHVKSHTSIQILFSFCNKNNEGFLSPFHELF
jgi:hypothetical protein